MPDNLIQYQFELRGIREEFDKLRREIAQISQQTVKVRVQTESVRGDVAAGRARAEAMAASSAQGAMIPLTGNATLGSMKTGGGLTLAQLSAFGIGPDSTGYTVAKQRYNFTAQEREALRAFTSPPPAPAPAPSPPSPPVTTTTAAGGRGRGDGTMPFAVSGGAGGLTDEPIRYTGARRYSQHYISPDAFVMGDADSDESVRNERKREAQAKIDREREIATPTQTQRRVESLVDDLVSNIVSQGREQERVRDQELRSHERYVRAKDRVFDAELAQMRPGRQVRAINARLAEMGFSGGGPPPLPPPDAPDDQWNRWDRANDLYQRRGQAYNRSVMGRFLGPPSGVGLLMSGMFGGWELYAALTASRQGMFDAASSSDPLLQMQAHAKAAQAAASGPLGATAGLITDILGVGPRSAMAMSANLTAQEGAVEASSMIRESWRRQDAMRAAESRGALDVQYEEIEQKRLDQQAAMDKLYKEAPDETKKEFQGWAVVGRVFNEGLAGSRGALIGAEAKRRTQEAFEEKYASYVLDEDARTGAIDLKRAIEDNRKRINAKASRKRREAEYELKIDIEAMQSETDWMERGIEAASRGDALGADIAKIRGQRSQATSKFFRDRPRLAIFGNQMNRDDERELAEIHRQFNIMEQGARAAHGRQQQIQEFLASNVVLAQQMAGNPWAMQRMLAQGQMQAAIMENPANAGAAIMQGMAQQMQIDRNRQHSLAGMRSDNRRLGRIMGNDPLGAEISDIDAEEAMLIEEMGEDAGAAPAIRARAGLRRALSRRGFTDDTIAIRRGLSAQSKALDITEKSLDAGSGVPAGLDLIGQSADAMNQAQQLRRQGRDAEADALIANQNRLVAISEKEFLRSATSTVHADRWNVTGGGIDDLRSSLEAFKEAKEILLRSETLLQQIAAAMTQI